MSSEAPAPRPLEEPPASGDPRADALRRLVAIVDRLRDPEGGCPWDLEQSVDSMAPSAIEEAHELVEAIETGDPSGTQEEAGDLLLVVTLICRIAEDRGEFDLAQVAQRVCEKLLRRHPHVFGESRVDGARGAIEGWERIKQAERQADGDRDASALAGVPTALPALQRIDRIGAKAIAAGFRWQSTHGALEKLQEELGELSEVYDRDCPEGGVADPERRTRLAEELGDVLLAGALLGTYLGIDPERAARESLRRFERRFRTMEAELGGQFRGAPIETLRAAWLRAKAGE